MKTRPIVSTAIFASLLATAANAAIYPYAEYHLGEAGSLGASNKPQDATGNNRHFSDDINGGSAVTGSASFHPNATGSTAYLDTSASGNEGWYSGNMYSSLPTDNFAFGVFARASSNDGDHQGDIFTLGNTGGSHKLSLEGNGWSSSAHNVNWIAPPGGVPGSFQPDTWVHLALIRKGGVTTFYVNGVANGTFSGAAVHASPHMSVAPGGGSYFDGHLDEARVVSFTSDEAVEDILTALQSGIVPSSFVETGVGATFQSAGLSTDEESIFRLGGAVQDSAVLTQTDGLSVAAGTAPKHIINISQEGEIPVGSYPLIYYTGSIGGLGFTGLQLAPLPGRITGTLVNNTVDSTIDLVVTASEPGDITWTGTGSSTWNIQGNSNWKFTGGSTATQFFPGDAVRFDETATNKNVSVGVAVTPSTVYITGGQNYSFSGAGIAGSAALEITGGGTVTFTNANTHSGSIYVDGSNIVVGDGGTTGSLGTGNTTLNGNLLVNRSGSLTMPNAITGDASIQKTGDGRLVLGGSSSFSGPVTLTSGVIASANSSSLGSDSAGTTVAAGATLDVFTAGVGNEPVTINGSGINGEGAIINTAAAGQLDGVRQLILASDSSIGGPNRWDVRGSGSSVTGNFKLTKIGNNHISMVLGTVSVKDIEVNGGLLSFEAGATVDNTNPGSITVNSGTLGFSNYFAPVTCTKPIVMNGGRISTTASGVDGSASIESTVTLSAPSTTIHADGGATITLSGSASGTGALNKDGTGTLLLSGNHAYQGNTTVAEGTLSLTATGLADASTVNLGSAAVLDMGYGGTDTVAALFINGVQQAAGVYAAAHASGRFSGIGSLTVTSGPTTTPYQTWETTNGISGAGSAADSDNDGIANGIEFVLGGDPSGPGSNSTSLLPTATKDATHFEFTFRRTDESAASTPFVEYGSDLSGWAIAQNGTAGVTISNDNDFHGQGIDRVRVRIPLPSGETSLFARLRVDIP
ncbi:autotransporter-associated beta strand repeat-containing protein [Luteolibacter sp. GHJ8]|uniref:Autotransporter-associated beta strand repeat-containing protein n=1 Tax=Luteolibacter rhizosphaerae TaxID=2989719 RepID=A0ABT3G6C1_9BACT|nr:autotransporter-associated beta strand repeat-containing protein [Luteolibacter rhizosphaerae]MCW1915385.1 autotransporter-associated beta strand repeat-containing protein [Luteolibacter rhizosphaerae]